MKKLSFIILFFIFTQAHANQYYLFTNNTDRHTENVQRDTQTIADSVTWLFDTDKKTITIFSEIEDIELNYKLDTTIQKSIFDKYIIDNGSIIYVDKETLTVIYVVNYPPTAEPMGWASRVITSTIVDSLP